MIRLKIACLGECMIELNHLDLVQGAARLGFAGDTLNTAIYLSRLGCDVSYITNLGTDAFSTHMLLRFEAEEINCGLIGRHETCLPGVYAIETDHSGERSFHYWREASAARTLFSGIGASLADLSGFDVIYMSGITLAILPPAVRAALIATAKALKGAGKQVVFDTNYRPRLWLDDATARESFEAMWVATSLALPSYDDEEQLYPGLTPLQVIGRIATLGPAEVVLKNGARGPMIRFQGRTVQTPMAAAARVVDTSGAGDSFNAGYLAARLRGEPPLQAAMAGHRLACAVIGNHGTVIARDAMPVLSLLAPVTSG
jgi:2-dehydro-3-deoxygluconokinase